MVSYQEQQTSDLLHLAHVPRNSSTDAPRRLMGELAVVILLALAVRGGVMVLRYAELDRDPDGYRAIAENLRTTGRFLRRDGEGPAFPTAYRPPLYPLLLAATGAEKLPIAVLHVLLGVVTVAGTFLLARRIGLERTAWVAAGLVLLDPLLLNQSTLVMTETLAAALTVAALAALVAWSNEPTWLRAILAGGCVGLCILCRPTYLIWLGLLTLLALVRPQWFSAAGPVVRRQVLGIAAAAVVVLLPWTLRNVAVFGRPIATTTHGGYTLAWGNNPYFYEFARAGSWSTPWNAAEFHAQWRVRRANETGESPHIVRTPQQELDDDSAAYRWAQESLRSDPSGCLLACLYRVRQFLGVLPNQLSDDESRTYWLVRHSIAVWCLALYILVVLGLPQFRWTPLFGWSLTLLTAFLLVHTFYWTDMRMRAPLMPAICLAAAFGVQRLAWRSDAVSPRD